MRKILFIKVNLMFFSIRKFLVYLWNFIFNHEVSPLKNIPDVAVRHYVLQILGFMWAICFSVALGSYTVFTASLVGHIVLIAAMAVTVATWTTAKVKPSVFVRSVGRSPDGEHH